jgi:NADH-quinone oxidoreductase subunit J
VDVNDPIFAGVFYLIAAIAVVSALGVVMARNIVYAAMSLVASFAGVAGIFVLLNADFLAAVQVLIYAGAIAILIVFSIMLTQTSHRNSNPSNQRRWPALLIAVAMLAVLLLTLGQTLWPLSSLEPLQTTTAAIGRLLLNEYVLVFEVVSVLLVAAMIGAIVIARED